MPKPNDESVIALWANTTLGLLLFWWNGTKQQAGRVGLAVAALPGLVVLDPRQLDAKQKRKVPRLLREFKDRSLLPANEAYRDEARQALDRAVLIELLGLPESILGSLELLRNKWCAEPTVHGGKKTRLA